jgi:uncharacterized RDD family membrane protein YckC
MVTGSRATNSTNHPLGGNAAVQAQLCAGDGVGTEFSNAAAIVFPEANIYSNSDLILELNTGPNADLKTELNADSSVIPKTDSWRVEVAARLERYRTRRKPRTPRYPSLLLPFDAPESWSRPTSAKGSEGEQSVGNLAPAPVEQDLPLPTIEEAYRNPSLAPEQYANVIEFPRSAAIPALGRIELADPIFDRPRIVEVPEILPPPPALGGMLIEPAYRERLDTAVESPAATASIAHRALAGLVDGAILATALAAFAAIFLRLNPVPGSLSILATALAAVGVLFWAAYEFLLVVYTGSTPGLRAARLQLAKFDGSPLDRHSRRWRVLASFLSAFSAGLGYLWCVLDQDGLCWHDRITRTHVLSKEKKHRLRVS